MIPKIGVAYNMGQFEKHQVELLAEELRTSGVELDLTETTTTEQAEAIDFFILHYNLPDEFWNEEATEATKEAVIAFFARLWRLARGKKMKRITGKTRRVITKHYIQVPRTIEAQKHVQYFLISNKLDKDVVITGIAELSKVSKKNARREPLNEQPYREDYIRLTKKGKWKRIKDMPKFRAKLLKINKENDKDIS